MESSSTDGLLSIFVGTFYLTVLSVTGFVTLVAIFICICNNFALRSKRRNALRNKHVVVTGGSSGIGRSVAIEAAARGANVTIIARNQSKLNAVKQDVLNACVQNSKDQTLSQTVCAVSMDVTSDYDSIEKIFKGIEEDNGPVFMLVNCAGTSSCAKFEDTPCSEFKNFMELNFMGMVKCAKCVVPGMKARGSGHIIFVSSLAGVVGVFGYTAYASSKFAVRGLAETLYGELKPYGVNVTLSVPPDTDTPGFIEEEKSKLTETRLISQSSGLVSPDVVASQLLDDAVMCRFFTTVGFENRVLTILAAGMSPFSSFIELIIQVMFMGILRLIGVGILISFENIVRKCMKDRNQAKKSE